MTTDTTAEFQFMPWQHHEAETILEITTPNLYQNVYFLNVKDYESYHYYYVENKSE